ncbi:HdeD family acid-resistance protein [Streptomyces acidicola]|uniref:HdeD family acid-resistance protein n=1 Tax=Streptomyces acidicola TaxID=2596892 RepID=A0A5N8X0Q0_9ACTN|nr:HdeD family acid-resistance protein [Streptomyces acidicola]MPY53119.1 HdeD family acid-resistance protein [Streptomyces acidicola]
MTASRGPAPPTGPEHTHGGAAAGPLGDPADVLAGLGRSWTWILGSAVAMLVPGILVLVWPGATLHVLAVVIGLYLLVIGVFRFVAAFAREGAGERLPALLLALLFVLAGVLCLRNPLQTIAALSVIVGVVWLVSGVLTLYTAIATKDLPHRGIVLGVAILGIVAGIVVLALPLESARALTRLLGVWLVLLGIAEAAVAFAWRHALHKGEHATAPHDPRPTV